MNVKTTIKCPELGWFKKIKLEWWFKSLCVTNEYYIFGFDKGIAKYSKSFKLSNTY
jgi:hypothetical protein